MSIDTLTADETYVLRQFRKAKSMPSARMYINLEFGRISQLEVTERTNRKELDLLNGSGRLKD